MEVQLQTPIRPPQRRLAQTPTKTLPTLRHWRVPTGDGKRLDIVLVGRFQDSKLLFAGKVHQGLNPTNRRTLLKLLQPLATPKCPFANLPTTKSGHWGEGVTAEEMGDYVWLRPEIEAEIKFAERTTGAVLRHAEFVAIRNRVRT